MFYSCTQSPAALEVNTLASKCAELIGNAASCSKVQRNPQKGNLSVLASSSCRKRRNAKATLDEGGLLRQVLKYSIKLCAVEI